MNDPLYHPTLLDHGRQPRRAGPLANATHTARVTNPLCGDRVTVSLAVAGGRVETFRFEARGCLVATASASLLGELVEQQPVDAVRDLLTRLPLVLVSRPNDLPPPLGALEPLASVRDFPARRACVELAWKALSQALG
jgi:nitrogen fixation NifU-like protein